MPGVGQRNLDPRFGPERPGEKGGAEAERFRTNPDPKTEVRWCARCQQAAMISSKITQHSVQGVGGTGWVNRDYVCQSCGAKVTLVDPKRIRALRLTAWLMIWAVVPTPILLLMANARKNAWSRHPLVPGAPYPAITRVQAGGEASRRCAKCGHTARPVSVTRHRSLGIPTGTEVRYLCEGCGAQLKIEGGAIFGLVQAALVAGGGLVAMTEAPEVWMRFGLGPLGIIGGGYLAYTVVRDIVLAARNPKIK